MRKGGTRKKHIYSSPGAGTPRRIYKRKARSNYALLINWGNETLSKPTEETLCLAEDVVVFVNGTGARRDGVLRCGWTGRSY